VAVRKDISNEAAATHESRRLLRKLIGADGVGTATALKAADERPGLVAVRKDISNEAAATHQSRRLLRKLIVSQLIKDFHGTRRFIIMLSTAFHCTVSVITF
jgi:hypothetical protein